MTSIKRLTTLILLGGTLLFSAGCLFNNDRATDKLNRILEAGNAALQAKQYDRAIEFYESGLAAAPNEPTFLISKSLAIRLRGVAVYNASIRLPDEKARTEGINKGKQDFRAAADLAVEAVKIVKSKSAVTLFVEYDENLTYNAISNEGESLRLLATIVDSTKADDALAALHETISIEPDKNKKLAWQLSTGKMLIDTYNGQKAVIEYQKILDDNPNNADALLGLGMALAQSGQADDFQKAKSILEKFLSQAPADHPGRATAKQILDSIPPETSK